MQDVHGSVKVSFKCPASYKEEFKDSHCLLVISVGQAAHEGEIFRSTIQLINNSFRECTILLGDSIQRHTLAINSPSTVEALYQRSVLKGDLWLERNKKFYDALTIPYNISRWDFWLNHPDYLSQRIAVNNLYETDNKVNEAFYMTVDQFGARYQKRLGSNMFNERKAFDLWLNYLQEECAVMCLWAQTRYDFEIYPRKRNPAMAIIYNLCIEPNYVGILNSVSLSIKPQDVDFSSTRTFGELRHEQNEII